MRSTPKSRKGRKERAGRKEPGAQRARKELRRVGEPGGPPVAGTPLALSVLSGHMRIMKMSWRVALKSACVMVQVESTLLHHMVHIC